MSMLSHHKSIRLVGLVVAWLLLLEQMPPAVAQPSHQDAEPTIVDLTLLDLDYTDQVLREDGASAEYTLHMPQNFQLRDESYLEVVFSSFVAAETLPAGLEVSLNGFSLGTILFSSEQESLAGSDQRRARLPLAASALRAGYNRLEIELETRSICGSYEPQVEAVIHAISYFHLVYNTPPLTPDLHAYPFPFYERTFLPSQVYIVLPQEPSSTDLSAALTVSAGLGRAAGSERRLAITSTLDISLTRQIQDNYNLIVIGQPGRNRLLAQLSLPLDGLSVRPEPGDGVLQMIPSPWNPARAILVVTGQSDTALYRASAALNRPSFLPGLRGQASIVKEVLPPPPAISDRPDVDRTFASLGYEDETFYGIVMRQMRYDFYLPRVWEPLEPARLFLSFNHSSIIDPTTSTLDVFLNFVPIGGTLLDETNQTDGVLELELPNWLLRPGLNRLDVQVEMHLSDEYCLPYDDPRAWTVIFRNSYLHLPLVAGQEESDLAAFPAPYRGDGHYEETVFVVPNEMTAGQRDALLRLAIYLGASGGSDYLALRVLRPSELSGEIKVQQHFILIGRPSRNQLFQEQAIADALPQPFEPGTDILLPRHDTVVVQQIPGWGIGLLQAIPSPWNPARRVLAITGTTDESVVWSLEALISSSRLLAGNLVVVNADGTLYPLDVYAQGAQQPPSVGIGVARAGEDMKWWVMLAEKWW